MKNGLRSYRVLFDTNILIDAVDDTRELSTVACLAIKQCNGGGDMGIATPSSLNDAYYILKKKYDEKWARNAIKHLLELIVVMPFGPEECLISSESNEPDFEDGLVRAAAELNDVDFIITRDAKAFKRSKIRAITCDEYLDIVESENEVEECFLTWDDIDQLDGLRG